MALAILWIARPNSKELPRKARQLPNSRRTDAHAAVRILMLVAITLNDCAQDLFSRTEGQSQQFESSSKRNCCVKLVSSQTLTACSRS